MARLSASLLLKILTCTDFHIHQHGMHALAPRGQAGKALNLGSYVPE